MAFSQEYYPFVESGEASIPPSFALGILQGAKDILSSYFNFSLQPLNFVSLPPSRSTPGNLLNPFEVDVSNNPHKILLTRRGLLHPSHGVTSARGITQRGVCIHPEGSYNDTLTIVSVPQTRYESDLDGAVAALVHEVGHSLGFEEHCALRSCLMYARHTPEALRKFSLVREPFCQTHSDNLESLNLPSPKRQ